MIFLLILNLSIRAKQIPPPVLPKPVAIEQKLDPRTEQILKTLKDIRRCESAGNDRAKNPYSSAKGRYQFIDSTWKYYGKMLWGDNWVKKDVLNGNDNEELARFVAFNFGFRDWDASYYCWGK